jgi:hypothetical protein
VTRILQPSSHVDGAAQHDGVVGHRITDLSGRDYLDDGVAGKVGT